MSYFRHQFSYLTVSFSPTFDVVALSKGTEVRYYTIMCFLNCVLFDQGHYAFLEPESFRVPG